MSDILELECVSTGLTEREQIAAMAMQGILSNAYWNEHGAYRPVDVSEAAVEYADALLLALSAGKGE